MKLLIKNFLIQGHSIPQTRKKCNKNVKKKHNENTCDLSKNPTNTIFYYTFFYYKYRRIYCLTKIIKIDNI